MEYEVNYIPRRITISRACGLLWNCTDILPAEIRELAITDDGTGLWTYGQAARAIRSGSLVVDTPA